LTSKDDISAAKKKYQEEEMVAVQGMWNSKGKWPYVPSNY
jgi:hypothetical protein